MRLAPAGRARSPARRPGRIARVAAPLGEVRRAVESSAEVANRSAGERTGPHRAAVRRGSRSGTPGRRPRRGRPTGPRWRSSPGTSATTRSAARTARRDPRPSVRRRDLGRAVRALRRPTIWAPLREHRDPDQRLRRPRRSRSTSTRWRRWPAHRRRRDLGVEAAAAVAGARRARQGVPEPPARARRRRPRARRSSTRTTGSTVDELRSRRATRPRAPVRAGVDPGLRAGDRRGRPASPCRTSRCEARYGGLIVPHARDERRFDPARYDRDAMPGGGSGVGADDRLLLFGGTPARAQGHRRGARGARTPRRRPLPARACSAPASSTSSASQIGTSSGGSLPLPYQPFDELAPLVGAADLVVRPPGPRPPGLPLPDAGQGHRRAGHGRAVPRHGRRRRCSR